MEVRAGFRVVRGPDWCWGEQDGGEGQVGTVVDVDQCSSGAVTVQWDCGDRSQYRCGGTDSMYDLRVWDTAPAGCKFDHCICDGCGFFDGCFTMGLSGLLWVCTRCHNYCLCTACYMAGTHCLEHKFKVQLWNTDPRRISVPARVGARKIEARGIFPGAVVVRGSDWTQNDDPDLSGKVVDIQDLETHKSAAQVEWGETQQRTIHRVGHNGKVDLKCTVPAVGYFYYPDHLPVLGAPHIPQGPGEFASGDLVRVELDLETFKQIQACIKWEDEMAEMVDRVGIVHSVADFGAVSVQYTPTLKFYLSADVLVKVTVPVFKPGDIVKVIGEKSTVEELQNIHGIWDKALIESLGQIGCVTEIVNPTVMKVLINGKEQTYVALCLLHDPSEIALKITGNQEVIEKPSGESATKDGSSLKESLQKCPSQVNQLVDGMAHLHRAARDGNIPALKVLLEFSPDLNIEDSEGQTPLCCSILSNQSEAAQLLIDAGADVNSVIRGIALLLYAAGSGRYRILHLLAQHPSIQLNAFMEVNGNTALHVAVIFSHSLCVAILLHAGADATYLNSSLDSPVHLAARNGNLPMMEEFVKYCPAHVFDVRAGNGFPPMLSAVRNGHGDIVALLAQTDIIQDWLNTALWLAVFSGFPKLVELLVGYGANLNVAANEDGETALHVLLGEGPELNMGPITDDMTQLKKIRDELLHLNFGKPVESYITVACFLVCEGADRYIRERNYGVTPFQVCPPEVGSIVTTFHRRHRRWCPSFHGSLRNPRIPLKQDSITTVNKESSESTTSKDSSQPVNLVTAEHHAESPAHQPEMQLTAAANEEFEDPTDGVPASPSSLGNKALIAEDDFLVVLQKLSTVCQSWYYIGLMLRVRVDKLDCIKLEHHDPQSCMVAMVSIWLRGLDPQPTWDALIQALHSCTVGEDQLAQKLALELKIQQTCEKLTTTFPYDGVLGIHHLSVVLEELYPARAKWYCIGLELGLPISTLNSIDKSHSTVKDRLCELLQCWLKGITPRPSLEAIIKTLRSSAVEEPCLAQQLAQEYCPQLMDTHTISPEVIPLGKLPPIVAYSEQLKRRYRQKPLFPDSDWPPTINTIKSYIPLSLTKVDKHEEEAESTNFLQLLEKASSRATRIVTDKVACLFSPLNDPKRQGEPIRVLIDGSPGVGKTTLCRKITTDWASGLEELRKYKLVVLLQLRDKRIAKAQSINDLFDRKSDVVDYVENSNGRDILMLLDGFEELHYEERSDSLIADLINGEILSECSLVVTSRPYASTGLLQLQSINRHVRILGFTKECMQMCIAKSVRGEELLTTLKEQQDIMAFMYTPLLCAIFLYVCADKNYLPRTQTDLFTEFVLNAINRHLKSHRSRIQLLTLDNLKPSSYKKDLDCLCKFALECLIDDKLVFHYEDLLSAFPHCPEDDDIETHCFGLLSANRSYTSSCEEVRYEFLHQMLQDYLAARCILTSKDIDQVVFFERYQDNIRFHQTLIFFAGLSKLQSTEFQRVFEQHFDLTYGKQAETFLLLIRSIFDSENHQLNRLLSKGIRDHVLNLQCSQMIPYDCKALGHFMTLSDCKWKSLYLPLKGLDDFSLKVLQRSCETLPYCHSSVETLGVGLLSVHQLTSGNETRNAFSLAAVDFISNTKLFSSLKVLKLTVNQPCSESTLKLVKDILKTNSTLQELSLHNSGIGNEALRYIADGLASNGTLKLLDIGRHHPDRFVSLDDFMVLVNMSVTNFLSGVSAATKLFDALRMNKCLEKLSCALQLGGEELRCYELLGNSLENMLAENKSLRSLELATFAHSDMTSEWPLVTEGLVTGLSRNSSLCELQLDSLMMGCIGSAQDDQNAVLQMDGHPPLFPPYSFVELFRAAEKHRSLAKLTVWGTFSEKEEIEAIVKAIGSNQTLRLVIIKTYNNVSHVQSQLSQCPGICVRHLPHSPLLSERNVNSKSGIVEYNGRQLRYEISSEGPSEKSDVLSIVSFS